MNVGILTFIGTQSHGACLQAYALRKKINQLGFEVEIINYISPGIMKSRKNKIPMNQKSIKSFIGTSMRYPIVKKRWKKFSDFEVKYLSPGEPVYSQKEMDEQYDLIVVGSDQVWNLEITNNDCNFFLGSIKSERKKTTYAASLGTNKFMLEDEKKCLELISEFKNINVRESSLQRYLSGSINKKVNVVLDPTLLLNSSEWNPLTNNNLVVKERYLLVHFPENTNQVWNKIFSIAKKKNLKIVYITNVIKQKKGCICLFDISPEEYLGYIRSADLIITGSFHTLCFSLIFNKEFWCTRSMIPSRNSRLTDLLSVAGCHERLLNKYSSTNINYETVNVNIATARNKSVKILLDSIKN